MKLSKDLYNAGILRRQRMGPNDDWGFDSELSLRGIWASVTGMLRKMGSRGARSAGNARHLHGRQGVAAYGASSSTRRGGNPWQPR